MMCLKSSWEAKMYRPRWLAFVLCFNWHLVCCVNSHSCPINIWPDFSLCSPTPKWLQFLRGAYCLVSSWHTLHGCVLVAVSQHRFCFLCKSSGWHPWCWLEVLICSLSGAQKTVKSKLFVTSSTVAKWKMRFTAFFML